MTTTALTRTPTNEARSIAEASRELLDRTYEQIRRGQVQAGMHELVLGLRVMRDIYPTAPWQSFSQNDCLLHAIRDVVHQDPFSRRSFDKPRGYPGDAGILDLIYGAVPLPEGTTEMGTEVYAYTVQAPACESVRARRDLIAEMIDETASVVDRPKVLSVACGHLREAGKSQALREHRIGDFNALRRLQREQRPAERRLARQFQSQGDAREAQPRTGGSREANHLPLFHRSGQARLKHNPRTESGAGADR